MCLRAAKSQDSGVLQHKEAPRRRKTGIKWDLLRKYEGVCSEIVPGTLFMAGARVACDLGCLLGSGITHVVNCVGSLQPIAFPDDFKYLHLELGGEQSPRRTAYRLLSPFSADTKEGLRLCA